ncbi:MAG: ORF6N domain-containing protein [Candidatus Omnitrophota bacterium]|nr:ORF6N domain-containing protein [Candidatus Omnitrophota bacterium]
MSKAIATEVIATRIFEIRSRKVMLDYDLAKLYGVSTKVLNQAVKRNARRFPGDFMFRLTEKEKEEVVTNCDHLRFLRFSYQLPYVFTEQGVAMLSSVLSSERAIQVNILIMRAFTKLREILLTHKELAVKIEALERKYAEHDQTIKSIFGAIKQLLEPSPVKEKKIIGFHIERK